MKRAGSSGSEGVKSQARAATHRLRTASCSAIGIIMKSPANGGTVTVTLNRKLVKEGFDTNPAQGNICLQSEGWEVYYRNVEVKELPQ